MYRKPISKIMERRPTKEMQERWRRQLDRHVRRVEGDASLEEEEERSAVELKSQEDPAEQEQPAEEEGEE